MTLNFAVIPVDAENITRFGNGWTPDFMIQVKHAHFQVFISFLCLFHVGLATFVVFITLGEEKKN